MIPKRISCTLDSIFFFIMIVHFSLLSSLFCYHATYYGGLNLSVGLIQFYDGPKMSLKLNKCKQFIPTDLSVKTEINVDTAV